MKALYTAWVSRWTSRFSDDHSQANVDRALQELTRDFDEAAEDGLMIAFLLGFGAPITPDGEATLATYLALNHKYLVGSLAPDITTSITSLTEFSEGDIRNALEPFASRTELYAQPHWTIIWEGVRESAPQSRIRVDLDPAALHCATCPEYEGEYDSWDALIARTGGLPGSWDSECGPGCRCGVTVL